MDKNIAIEFDGVGKQYRLGLVGTGSLQHDINRWWQTTILRKEDPYLKIGEVNDRSKKGTSDYVWALKDISFKVEQGDVVGIIGKNGAGKSTLLKLLSHITAPSVGHIRYRGRIASLLEVGTGFHPEMTARQNIYMNGSIMGMTRHEITSKLDEIVDFAGIERYLDTPVKRFSSGMTVRLGFAVAAFLEPEILVVDEVLAVGDVEFQKKAIGKMQEVSSSGGRTVLFVSHNMDAVRSLCKKGVVLKNGMIDYSDTADRCVDYYIANNYQTLRKYTKVTDKDRLIKYMREVEFVETELYNDNEHISSNETLRIRCRIKRNNDSIKSIKVAVLITNAIDKRVGTFFSDLIELHDSKDVFDIYLEIGNMQLIKGKYSIDFGLCQQEFTAETLSYDNIRGTLSFDVRYFDNEKKIPFSYWNNRWGQCAYNRIKTSIE